jgi:Skp family chaperone for outer membrane proteins
MEIRVVDFDVLTRNFKNYQEGIRNLSEVRTSFIRKLDPLKNEMEKIIKAANSGLIMDDKSQRESEAKFSELQEGAMAIDSEFKSTMKREQDNLNKVTYDELSIIIDEWSLNNDVDMVIGKMEVVFLKEKYEITNEILDLLKSKDLYVEFTETETVTATKLTDVEELKVTIEQA